MQQSS